CPGNACSPPAAGGVPLRIVVCPAAELAPGTSKVVREPGHPAVAVFHHEGRFHAIANRCPHHGAPLANGWVETRLGMLNPDRAAPYVTCPWHAWAYDMETGQGHFPEY